MYLVCEFPSLSLQALFALITLITLIFIKEPPREAKTPEQLALAKEAEKVNLLKVPMIRRMLE